MVRSHRLHKSGGGPSVGLRFDLNRVSRAILVTAVLVAAVQVGVGLLQQQGLDRRIVTLLEYFDTNGALTFNSWFSSLVIAATAIAALVAARSVEDPGLGRRLILASAILGYLSLDKATGLSEYLGLMLPRFIDVGDWKWITLGVLVGVGAVFYMVGLFRGLASPAKIGLATGGFVFIGGALVLDSLGHSSGSVDLISVAEELAETVGMLIIAQTLFLIVRDGMSFDARDVFAPFRVNRGGR